MRREQDNKVGSVILHRYIADSVAPTIYLYININININSNRTEQNRDLNVNIERMERINSDGDKPMI